MLFVGIDWAEAHHDICLLDDEGKVLARSRIIDGLAGVAALHELIASHADTSGDVVIAIEIDRGLLVSAMVGAGYQVFAINPLSVSRYRDRHHLSGAKSDPGDAKVLADLARTDRHNHRALAGDSPLCEAIRVVARAHQSAVWSRQRQASALRHSLRFYYPAALTLVGNDLTTATAIGLLSVAPTPALGRRVTVAQLAASLRRGGRQRNLDHTARHLQQGLRTDQLQAHEIIADAYGHSTRTAVTIIAAFNTEIARLEQQLELLLQQHPAAPLIRSIPGLGTLTGSRTLGEFGDDPTRYTNARCRKNYAGTSPITRASGRHHVVVGRFARNRRLADACDRWAFCSITASPGARRYYDQLRARGKTHGQALRQLANRWVGILHICLERQIPYDEQAAWQHLQPTST
jgi:Transposase/Transposase IS116/IS110/IS902 family